MHKLWVEPGGPRRLARRSAKEGPSPTFAGLSRDRTSRRETLPLLTAEPAVLQP